MKNITNKLLALLVALTFIATSCDDDKEPLNKEQAQDAFTSANENFSSAIERMQSNPGFTAIEDLNGLAGSDNVLPFRQTTPTKKDPRVWARQILASLKNIATAGSTSNARTQGEESFDFSENTGVYEWSSEGGFTKTANSTIIELRFPTEGSTTNNATFKLFDYDEVATPDGDEAYSPTLIDATLSINGTQVAALDATAEYRNDGTDDAIFADITYTVGAFSVDLDFNDKAANATSFSQVLREGNNTIIGWGITAVYNSAEKIEEDIKSIEGFFQLINIRFTISATQPSSNATDVNDFIKINITVDDAAAGRVVIGDDGEPYVEYRDGSRELLADIFNEIDEVFNSLDF
ncbi:MAG: hypothetical protein ACK5X6_07390 [Chryseotalea sp.]